MFAGLIRQPKWGHMKDLHAAIKLCEPALIAVDGIGQYTWLGSNQEVLNIFILCVFLCEVSFCTFMLSINGVDYSGRYDITVPLCLELEK